MHTSFWTTLPTNPFTALLIVFVAGLLSVATPCVLPMVPITMATIGVTRTTTRGRAVRTAASYVAGIVLTFTTLGIAFAMTGKLFGSILANPATALVIAAVFVAMALSSFEILPFRLPSRLTQAVTKVGGRGPLGAFVAGLVAGFIAAPCIGPVLAAILSYVTTTRDMVWGAALLATYGLGFGTPFLLVGAFALRLPKAGPWLEAVKALFGVALLVGAYWFLRGAFPALRRAPGIGEPLSLTLLIVTVAAMLFAFAGGASKKVRAFTAALASLAGVLTMNVIVKPDLRWCEERPDRHCVADATKTHARTIVLYTADWCPACHKLESETLRDPAVAERLRDYGTVIVDVDANAAAADRADIEGMPTIVVLDRDGTVIGKMVGYLPPEEFLAWLDSTERH